MRGRCGLVVSRAASGPKTSAAFTGGSFPGSPWGPPLFAGSVHRAKAAPATLRVRQGRRAAGVQLTGSLYGLGCRRFQQRCIRSPRCIVPKVYWRQARAIAEAMQMIAARRDRAMPAARTRICSSSSGVMLGAPRRRIVSYHIANLATRPCIKPASGAESKVRDQATAAPPRRSPPHRGSRSSAPLE